MCLKKLMHKSGNLLLKIYISINDKYNEIESQKKESSFIFSILLSILTFILVFKYILYDSTPAVHYILQQAPLFLQGGYYISPEPNERSFYIFGVFLLPLFALFYYSLIICFVIRINNFLDFCLRPIFNIVKDIAVVIFFILWFYVMIKWTKTEMLGTGTLVLNYAWWKYALTMFSLLIFIPISIKATRLKKFITLTIGIAIIGFTTLPVIVTESVYLRNSYVSFHLNFILGAVNQVLHGNTVLVNLHSTYGILYPYITAIFLKVFNFSILNLSLFFLVLIFLTWFFIFMAIIERVEHNLWYAVFTLCSLLGISHPYFISSTTPFAYRKDIAYYQYMPLRMIFGAFFIWFISRYIKNENTKNYILGFIISAIAILWNMDSGIVVSIAWVSFLVYNTLSKKDINIKERIKKGLIHIGVLALSVFGAYLFYSIFSIIRSGKWPIWFYAFEYQSIFYKSGYGMLAMKNIDLWHIPVFIYFLIVFNSLISLLYGKTSNNNKLNFYLALYGLGTFSYYQGRSHITTMMGVSYPSMIIVSFIVFDIIRSFKKEQFSLFNSKFRLKLIIVLPLVLILTHGFLNSVSFSTTIYPYFKSCFDKTIQIPSQIQSKIDIVNENKKSDKIIIMDNNADYIHYKTNTYSALPFPSLYEVLLVKHVEEIQEIIDSDNVRQVFVDKKHTIINGSNGLVDSLNFSKFTIYGSKEQMVMPREKNLVAYGSMEDEGNRIQDLGKKINTGIIHGIVQFNDGIQGKSVQFNGKDTYIDCGNDITLNSENNVFSINLWFKTNRSYAGENTCGSLIAKQIINPPYNGYSLWFRNSNKLSFDIFDGAKYRNAVVDSGLELNDGKWHHIVVVVNKDSDEGILIYQDGQLANVHYTGSKLGEMGAAITSSNFIIGGRDGSNLLFTGFIDEVQYYNCPLSESEVKGLNYAFIHKKYKKNLSISEIKNNESEGLIYYLEPYPRVVGN